MSSDRSFIFLTALVSIGGSALAIHSFMWGDFLNGVVAAIHSFRVYMEQIIFDSSYLLRPANFLEDLSYAFDFLRAVYLFNHSNCSHPSLEVVYLFLCFIAAIHNLKCTVSFSFCCITCCHSFSFVAICCHFFSLVAIRCHSLSFAVSRCHSMYSVFFTNDPKKQSVALWEELRYTGCFFMENAGHYKN